MIDVHFDIPDFGWTVHFHCAVTCYHTDAIINELQRIKCPVAILKRAHSLMSSCRRNTGMTYSSKTCRESVIVVSQTADASEFLSTVTHEIRHLVDDLIVINDYYDKEDVAYLTGNIHKALYPHIQNLLCDGCRNRVKKSRQSD